MKWTMIVVGALLTLFGAIWALQGFNLLGGSAMSGSTTWAVAGPITALIGLLLLVLGLRRR
jgi:hypothetical protein